MKIFTESFSEVTDQTQLDQLITSNPRLDPGYLGVLAIKWSLNHRQEIESLWERYEPYADPGFVSRLKVKGEFLSRCWEMFVTCALLDQGHMAEEKRRSDGPDATFITSGSKIHLEAVSIKSGTGADAVLEMLHNAVTNLPVEAMILRFANGIDDKVKCYKKYIESGLIAKDEPYVIAISKGEIIQPDAMPSIAIRYLHGVGDFTLTFPLPGGQGEPISGNRLQEAVTKKSGNKVDAGFFSKKEHMGISAVIYCPNHILNHPSPWGSDFIVIKNPFATNPIPDDWLSRGAEWKIKEDKIILHEKGFTTQREW